MYYWLVLKFVPFVRLAESSAVWYSLNLGWRVGKSLVKQLFLLTVLEMNVKSDFVVSNNDTKLSVLLAIVLFYNLVLVDPVIMNFSKIWSH